MNAVGEVVDEDGSILVGPKLEPGERREDLVEQLGPSAAANTTLGVVATNAALSKEDVRRLASVGNDAFDVAIRPAHTIYDGDTVFALATQQVEATLEQVASLGRGRGHDCDPSSRDSAATGQTPRARSFENRERPDDATPRRDRAAIVRR